MNAVKKVFFYSLVIVLLFVAGTIFVKPNYADPTCHAIACELEGKNCVCCLIMEGSIMCGPCGFFDCKPLN
jgi:hypothetical protein